MESELDGLESIRQKYDQLSARKRDGFSSQNNWNTKNQSQRHHEHDDISEEDGEPAHEEDQTHFFPTDADFESMSYKPPEPLNMDQHKKFNNVKITIKGIDIYFPFKPYDAQVEYMTKVIDALNGETNALLQSPTGTGKTLCLLCATLGWLAHYRRKFIDNPSKAKDYKPVKILYSSRTHSQIKQVIKELKQTCYRPITCILGSRDQLCIKTDFTGVSGLQLNAACKQARISAISEQRCTYSDGYNKNKGGCISKHKNNLYDIEELATIAKKERFCPYFYERDLLDRADLIMLPYNYIMDGRIRGSMGIKLINSILVFDEAHNIERVAEDGCSFTISMRDLENCELDFKLLKQKARQEEETKMSIEDIETLEFPIMNMMRNMTRVKRDMENEMRYGGKKKFGGFDDSQKGKIDPGREIFTIFKEWTKGDTERFGKVDLINPFKNGIDEFNIQEFMNLLMKSIEDLSSVPTSKGGLDNMAFAAMTVANLLSMDRRIRSKGTNKDLSQNFIDSYILQSSFGEEENPVFGIALLCLHPGVGFDYIKETKPRNILLTSGTLAPLSSFQSELMVEFPVKLENGHVIDTKTQVYTAIMRKGPSGVPLNFSYDQRDNMATYKEMGNVLLNIARLVPNGVLVCFASYALMNKCFEIWSQPDDDIVSKIESLKKIHKEPKRSSQLGAVMEKYLKDAKTKGAILCCVCRGKVSEGIDFADEMARAVVVIGIPFPALGDLRVSYKKKYLNDNQRTTKRISGNEWYMQQTVRAVNQAIGRVIRHINDHGVVFLCDERFGRPDFTRDLPQWLKDNQEVVDKFGFMVGKVVTFFRDKKNNPSLNKLLGVNEKVKPIVVHDENSLTQTQAQTQDTPLSEVFGNNRYGLQPEERSNSRSRPEFQRNERSNGRATLYNADPRSFGLQSQPIPAMPGMPGQKSTPQNIYDSYREHQDTMALAMNSRQRGVFRGAVEGLRDIEDQGMDMLTGVKKVKKEEKKSPVPVEKQNILSQYFKSSQSPVSKGGPSNTSPQQKPNTNNPFRMVGMSNTQQAPPVQKISVERIEIESPYQGGFNARQPTPSPVIIEQMSELSFGPNSLENQQNENSMNATNMETPPQIAQTGQNAPGGLSCVICYEGPEGRNFMTPSCGHLACQGCWEKWLALSNKCPTCRKAVNRKRLIKLHL